MKKFFVYFVLTLLVLPLGYLLGIKDNTTVVYGFEKPTELPSLQNLSYTDGQFQKQFESWWQQKFLGRKIDLKLKNQLYDWANFGKIHSGFDNNIVEGKHNYLFGKYFFYALSKQCPQIPDFSKLAQFVEIAKQKNIELYFILAPSKALVYKDYLPKRWTFFLGDDCHINDKIAEQLQKLDIKVYNAQPLAEQLRQENSYQPFPRTGIHWNAYGAGKTFVEAMKSFNFGNVKITSIEERDTPYFAEQDLYKLKNVFNRRLNDIYYKPILNADFQLVGRTAIIGNSFSNEFKILYLESKIQNAEDVIFYENQPLTKEDVHKIYQSKRIFFVYNVEIAQPYNGLDTKLNILVE